MRILVGNTAWFVHRNRLTGLLVEPRLARCYAKKWTPVAVDILVRGSHEHRLEFRQCWNQGVFSHSVLENVCSGMVRFLHVNDFLNPSPKAWSLGLEQFLRGDSVVECLAFEDDAFGWMLHPSIGYPD